jgi:hypothetical protein
MPLSWEQLGSSVGINVAVCVGAFVAFNYLRRNQWLSDFYGAKRKLSLPFRCDANLFEGLENKNCLTADWHVGSYFAPASPTHDADDHLSVQHTYLDAKRFLSLP